MTTKPDTAIDQRKWIESLPLASQVELLGDGLCAMTGCGREMTSILRIDATHDGKKFAVRTCTEHYEYLLAELAKSMPVEYLHESPGKGQKGTRQQ
jgi:hypothetical protein